MAARNSQDRARALARCAVLPPRSPVPRAQICLWVRPCRRVCHWLAALSKNAGGSGFTENQALFFLRRARIASSCAMPVFQGEGHAVKLPVTGGAVKKPRSVFCKHRSLPCCNRAPLTMIAAALTIFRSGLFRAFELIVRLILQNKINWVIRGHAILDIGELLQR